MLLQRTLLVSSWTVPSLGRLDCFSESPFMNEMYCSDRVVATCTHTQTEFYHIILREREIISEKEIVYQFFKHL